MHTVLIVDDEEEIREEYGFALREEGFNVTEAGDGIEALECVERDKPALIVLDIIMPRMNGIDCALKLKQTSDIPIVFLTSKHDEKDMLHGLNIGGVDYVTKPFSPKVLALKVGALLRHTAELKAAHGSPTVDEPRELSHCGIQINLEENRIFYEDKEVLLTPRELETLKIMMNDPRKNHAKDDLIEKLSGGDPDQMISNAGLDAHIKNIRDKFKEVGCNPIETRHGTGLILMQCD